MDAFEAVKAKIDKSLSEHPHHFESVKTLESCVRKHKVASAAVGELKDLFNVVQAETFKEIFAKSLAQTESVSGIFHLLGDYLKSKSPLRTKYEQALDDFNKQFIIDNIQEFELQRIIAYCVGFDGSLLINNMSDLVELMKLDIDAPKEYRQSQVVSEFIDVKNKEVTEDHKQKKWFEIDVEADAKEMGMKYAVDLIVNDANDCYKLSSDVFLAFLKKEPVGSKDRRRFLIYSILCHIIFGCYGTAASLHREYPEFANDKFISSIIELNNINIPHFDEFSLEHGPEFTKDPLILQLMNELIDVI